MARPLVHEAFEPFKKDQAELNVDIAVVGAGVSGAYSAWRLKQKYPRKRVTLFEYSNRVGGRLYSTPLPGMPNIKAELGGMRYIPDSQAFVRELIENQGLPTRDFPMGAPDDPGGMNNLMYLRRRLMRARDLTNPAMVPYLMNPTEQGMNPDQLQAYVMNSLVPNAANLTPDQWNEVKIFNGEPLYKTGFWNLLYRVLTSEAYQFMDDAGGYYTNVANSTSVLSLPVFEFGPNVRYKTLDAGYEALPQAVVQSFVDENGDFQPNLRLDSLAKRGDEYSMLFVRTSTDPRGCTNARTLPGESKETLKVSAKQVILAMPRRSLELIRWEPLQANDDVRHMVNAVISQAAFKIFLGYPYPWWRVLGLQAGRSITDMPLRQTFYFQTEGEQKGADPNNLNSLMMVSYNDLGSVPFWKALEAQTLGPDSVFRGRPNPFVTGSGEPATPQEITTQMVDTAQALVREIHNLQFVPEPYTAAYHDWSEDPYGAGWHAWKAGVEFWKVMPRIRKPVVDENVFICGEAYSINQGWVEGALQTAELMLEEHFGLKRPSWLPKDYNLWDIKSRISNMAKPTITVAEYLILRLKEFGAEHIFAVPGDYAGPFLSVVDKTKQITRVGVTNEWVAGYAADSYARLKGTGAMCLTYGVGTFGALNCLAGSYVEELPVALIVGSPSFDNRQVERHEGVLYHHSTGKLSADRESVKNVVVASEVVRSGKRAAEKIDHALNAALTWRRPVYIEVFQNAWTETCRPPEEPLQRGKLPLSKRSLESAVDQTLKRLEGATVPVIWAGVEVQRFGLQELLEEVIRVTRLPWTTDLLGKSVLSEDLPGFQGVFDGASAVKNVMDLFNASNWVLGLGNIVTDDFAVWVQGHYDNLILAYNNSVRVGRKTFDDVPLEAFMKRIAERLSERTYKAPVGAMAALEQVPTPGEKAQVLLAGLQAEQDDQVDYNNFFERMKTWVDDSMVLMADTSIALYSAAELPVASRNGFIAQAAWNSIGYTPGGAVGVGYAAPDKRAVVFCGDGSFQEIVQAVSDIVRSGHDAVIFVFNNALYGIEQAFVDPYYFVPDKEGKRHPPEPFDLLHAWDYAKLTEVFGGGWSAVVNTLTELDAALEKAKTNRGLSLIDLRIPQDSITLQMLQQAGVNPEDPPAAKKTPAKKAPAKKPVKKPARKAALSGGRAR